MQLLIFFQISFASSLLLDTGFALSLSHLPKIHNVPYHQKMVQHNLKRAKQLPIVKSWYTNRAKKHQDLVDIFGSLKLNSNMKTFFGVPNKSRP